MDAFARLHPARRADFICVATIARLEGLQLAGIGGLCDPIDGLVRGLPEAPGRWHVLAVKRCSEAGFTGAAPICDAVEQVAAQLHMHITGLRSHCLIALSPDR